MYLKILLVIFTLFGFLSADTIKVKGGLIYKNEGKAQINQEYSIFKRTVDTEALRSIEQRLVDGTKLYKEFCAILTNYEWKNYHTAEDEAVKDARRNNLSVTFFSTPLKYPIKDSEQVCHRLRGRRPEIADIDHYNAIRSFAVKKEITMFEAGIKYNKKINRFEFMTSNIPAYVPGIFPKNILWR